MERHLTANVSVMVALFAAHRERDAGQRPGAALSSAEMERIADYLRDAPARLAASRGPEQACG